MGSKSAWLKTNFIRIFLEPDRPQVFQGGRVAVFDDMRALACLCVVLYHAAGSFNAIQNIPAHAFDWWVGNIYTGLALNFLSPVFFILSGAILLNPARGEQSIATFLKRRARAILPPFLVGSLVYYLYTHLANGPVDLLNFLAITFGEPQYYHLWFFYSLIGLYFLTPILRPLFTPEHRQRVEYMLLLWIIVTAVVPLLQRFTPIRVTVFPSAFMDYTGYFLFGGYFFNLRRWNLKRSWALTLPVLMTAITLSGNWFLSLAEGHYDSFFANQVGLNIILSTVCLVSLFAGDPLAGARAKSPAFARITRVLSRQSLWIYIFHPLLIDLLPFGLPFLKPGVLNPLLRVPVTGLLAVLLVALAAELASRGKAALSHRLQLAGKSHFVG